MEFFEGVYRGVAENPLAALLVLALIAMGWMFRDMRARDREITALHEAHSRALQEAHAAHLQTVLQIAPLTGKLVSGIEALERLTNAALSRLGGADA